MCMKMQAKTLFLTACCCSTSPGELSVLHSETSSAECVRVLFHW